MQRVCFRLVSLFLTHTYTFVWTLLVTCSSSGNWLTLTSNVAATAGQFDVSLERQIEEEAPLEQCVPKFNPLTHTSLRTTIANDDDDWPGLGKQNLYIYISPNLKHEK